MHEQRHQTPQAEEVDTATTPPPLVDGRPLRVLHSGNIANNAYLNAKALRVAGVEAEVLSEDYYHIMGCPEWEDADFLDGWGDDFAPDWSSVELKGFVRPPWFHGGGFLSCLQALRSSAPEAEGEPLAAEASTAEDGDAQDLPDDLAILKRGSRRSPTDLLVRWKDSLRANPKFQSNMVRYPWLEKSARLTYQATYRILIALRSSVPGGLTPPEYQRAKEVAALFDATFPERRRQVRWKEMLAMVHRAQALRGMFDSFDIVHFYGTQPIDGLLSGTRPYVAYEHGTIRALPFQKTTEAALIALSYRMAEHVFITNSDNRIAAERLGITNYSFIPHPVNEDFLEPDDEAERLRRDIRERYDARFVLLHPSRQHWSPIRDPSLEKGNDILIHGFARFVKEVEPRALAVMIDWGVSVDASKTLLRELECADRVLWIKPLPHRAFVRWIHASDAVADQFFLGAFGSLTPKAMACGKPLLLNLNEDLHRWCFDELPPVLNTKTADDVFKALEALGTDPAQHAAVGRKSADWYWKHHSMESIRSQMFRVYRDIAERHGLHTT